MADKSIDKQVDKYYNEAMRLFDDEVYDKAILPLTRAIKLDGANPDYYEKRSWCYIYTGESKKAIEDIDKALSIVKKPEYYIAKAYALINDNNNSEAYAALDTAINMAPGNPDYHSIKGDLLLDDKKYGPAIEQYNIAIKILPGVYQFHYGKAMTYSYMEKFPEALEEYNRVIEIEPNFGEAYYNRSIIYLNQGKFEDAILDAERAIDLESDVPDNFDLMGNILTAMKKYKEALKYYAEAIELDSRFAAAYYDMGIMYDIMKNYSNAIENYDKAIKLVDNYYEGTKSPSNAAIPAFLKKAHDLYLLNKADDAIATYEQALKREPGSVIIPVKMSHVLFELARYSDVISLLSPVFSYGLKTLEKMCKEDECENKDLVSGLKDLINSCNATGKKENVDSYNKLLHAIQSSNTHE
ncbi:tetratricopeptide repeat protein [Ferroplasma acidiphilum]|jgi:tetratricopeptide (TPR) repeat protein|uniref:tetratricopeptide repeat protein n=1 Tax=Ferroplasma acidiphilum TaxID=74969 RepID=UPI0023EF8243|nr:tetratricopeptide repeat protein [Ferroplasma acidiphilum]